MIDAGRRHIAEEAWDNLREVNHQLWRLLPQEAQKSKEYVPFSGIV